MMVCKGGPTAGGIESVAHVVRIKQGRERDSCVERSLVQAELKTGKPTGAVH